MSDEKKYDPCEPEKKEEENHEHVPKKMQKKMCVPIVHTK